MGAIGTSWITGGMVAVALLAGANPARALPPVPVDALCGQEVAAAEQRYGIPHGLLKAISIVESGRYDSERRATIAWPWTVMAEGEGRYFPSKAEAVAEVRRLKARGVANIDVGCMQVNLRYHPTAFESLDEAFDPEANVGYAARFLLGLFEATRHWPTAASYYHSQTPGLAATYRDKLMKVWARTGDEATTQLAAAAPRPATPDRRVARAEPRQAPPSRAQASQEEARIANAYRQARLAEYQLRRARFQEIRLALGQGGRR